MATAKKEAENAAVETAAKEELHESTYSVEEYCKAGVVAARDTVKTLSKPPLWLQALRMQRQKKQQTL